MDDLKSAIQDFIAWFEDNFGEEEWLDLDSDNPDGVWKSYLELPEYTHLVSILKDMN